MTPLLILGTFHFASALDLVNNAPGDMSTVARQAGLDGIAADVASGLRQESLADASYGGRHARSS